MELLAEALIAEVLLIALKYMVNQVVDWYNRTALTGALAAA